MVKINIPLGAEAILKTLHHNNYEAYVVGGCVRDSLLNKVPNDWDITTNCLPEEVMSIFQSEYSIIPTGLKHGTVTLLGEDKIHYEVTTYRVDGEYSDGRHPDKVEFTKSLKEDLSRRDFTINALAYNDEEGLIDYFQGTEDIKNKIIKCVGDPVKRFSEDALRMLRAYRFSAQLDFKIEDGTVNAVRLLAANIKNVSVERIREEFNKILLSDNPVKISELNDIGLLKHFIPEYDICEKTTQENPYNIYSVGKHLLHSVEAAEKGVQLRLAVFLHDIAKSLCKTTDEFKTDHFYNHADKSAELAGTILKRMKYDNRTIEKVIVLIKYHDLDIKNNKQVKRLLNKIGEANLRDLLKVKEANIKAQNLVFYESRHMQLEKIKAAIDDVISKQQCFAIKDMEIDGRDLIQLGIKHGKEIGLILNELLEMILDDPELNSKDRLMHIVKTKYIKL